MIGWLLFGASIIGLELMNYIYYKKTVDYVEQKTLVKLSSNFNTEVWEKNYWLNDLSNEEIIEWITNTFHCKSTSTTKITSTVSTSASSPTINLSNSTIIDLEDSEHRSMSTPNINKKQNVRLEEITANKMLRWLCYQMYFKPYKTLTEDQIDQAKLMMIAIETKLNYTFPETIDNAINTDLHFLKFGSTQIETSYKPVVVYCAMSTVKNLAYMYLRYLGFTKHTMKKTGMIYFYYKNPKNLSKTSIFIHGLGFGITPYINFVKTLMTYTDVIIPILPNISNMEFHSILDGWKDTNMFPNYEDLRCDFEQVLIQNDLYNVSLMGHSFGTIIMSILLRNKNFKQRIGIKIFVDPVCFMDDCYKIFNYIKQPDGRDGDLATSIFNSLIYDDVYVRYTTQRYLYGPEYWLIDYDVLLNNSIVILSGDDKIVPSPKLHKKLENYGIACIYVNTAEHADIFSLEKYSTVINTIIEHINHSVSLQMQ